MKVEDARRFLARPRTAEEALASLPRCVQTVAPRVPCCERDNDGNGNCDRHPDPYVRRTVPTPLVGTVNAQTVIVVEGSFGTINMDDL